MMLYSYRCIACGYEWDQRRPVEERNAPIACPECGGQAMRVFNRPLAIFGFPPFTGQWTRGELARAVAPETEEEKRIWREYG